MEKGTNVFVELNSRQQEVNLGYSTHEYQKTSIFTRHSEIHYCQKPSTAQQRLSTQFDSGLF